MKTPREFNNNLKKGILTKEMLEACLLSVNKRAKNWRDREREYRQYREDYYDNCEKAREKKEYYYWKKEILLSILKPTCIHRELLGFDSLNLGTFYRKQMCSGSFVLNLIMKFTYVSCHGK